jgi:hypothetical protein
MVPMAVWADGSSRPYGTNDTYYSIGIAGNLSTSAQVLGCMAAHHGAYIGVRNLRGGILTDHNVRGRENT